ncbi:MAG: hypothetical protein GY756_16580, partial [bacterium]|nr:hypothetical protein [bacterium]
MLSKIAKNRYLFTAAFTILLTIILSYTIIFTKVTLGIKGEWVWQRVANVSIYYQNIILSIILFMISIFIAIKIDHKIKRKSYKIILILIISLISLYTDYRITSDSKIGNSESIHSIIDKLTIEYLAIDGDIKSHKNFFSSFLDFLNFSSTKKVNHKYIHSPGNILISHLSYRTILNYPRIKNILLLFTSKDKIMHAYHETKNQNYFPSSKDFEATYFTALLIYFIMLLALFAAKLL